MSTFHDMPSGSKSCLKLEWCQKVSEPQIPSEHFLKNPAGWPPATAETYFAERLREVFLKTLRVGLDFLYSAPPSDKGNTLKSLLLIFSKNARLGFGVLRLSDPILILNVII